MILRLEHRIRHGSQADLFDPGDGRIYKLFRAGRNDAHTCGARMSFEAERDALRIATEHEVLRHHIARFHGPQEIEGVLGEDGARQDGRYLLDCCYATEKLDGEELSPFGVPEVRDAEVMSLLEQFEAAGINYAEDGSVFGWEPGRTIRFIDIATRDIRAWLPD